jgi:hypothetical protein
MVRRRGRIRLERGPDSGAPGAPRRRTLYVSGTVANQGRFYPQFDAVVLLSAPVDVLLDRIARRTTNAYGKSDAERELVLAHLAEVEPLLRATCTHEIDATRPVDDVVDQLVAVGEGGGSPEEPLRPAARREADG